jgi:hypothetical protein
VVVNGKGPSMVCVVLVVLRRVLGFSFGDKC